MADAQGRISTFYSYKGGTGRSMALANFAWIMAASGKRVLAIDWDLEAPGLHRYFRPFLIDPDLFETDGLIDTFWNLVAAALRNGGNAYANGEEVADAFVNATQPLESKYFPSTGGIDFIGAGRQGSTYSERVNGFDWKRFYDLGGLQALTGLKRHLRKRYDWILIDSRTGVSDTSGICTIQMPDMVVAFFTLNRQSIDGVAAILRSIRAFHSSSVDGSTIRLFPIATRIEYAEQDRLEAARVYARAELMEFLPDNVQSSPREYWDKMEISYRPKYAFEEILAAFGDTTGAGGAKDTMLSQVEATAQQITGDEDLRMPEILEKDREEIVAKYSFGVDLRVIEISDDTDFLRRIRLKEQVWRTSKFYWRLLLSRRELDLLTDSDKKEFGRSMAFYHIQSERMHKLLRRGQVIGSGVFIALILGLLLLRVPTLFPLNTYERRVFALLYLFGVVIGALAISAFARGIVAAVTDKPHGVRLVHLLKLSLYGPFGPQIRDYDPDVPSQNPKSNR